jgi:hypothetical protein
MTCRVTANIIGAGGTHPNRSLLRDYASFPMMADLITSLRASHVRAPHAPAVYVPDRDTPRSLFNCRWTTYPPIHACGYICITHEPHSSPFLKPTEAHRCMYIMLH